MSKSSDRLCGQITWSELINVRVNKFLKDLNFFVETFGISNIQSTKICFWLTGGHSSFFGLLNTFVHIAMYTYYLLAALGPKIQPYLWWKRYLTSLQMVQFVLVMVHAFQLLFIECDYPRAFVWWIGMHAVLFYFLFRDFYNQAYKKSSAKVKKSTDNGKSVTNGQEKNSKNQNGTVYPSQYKMATAYITNSGSRHRVFIDSTGSREKWFEKCYRIVVHTRVATEKFFYALIIIVDRVFFFFNFN